MKTTNVADPIPITTMTVDENPACIADIETNVYSYPVKSVVINTCASLYQRWTARKRMYAKANQGLTVKVEYADTKELCHTDRPVTVLALHGAPGSHEDYQPFIEHFGVNNVRIIVPNYPDFSFTIKSKVFRHSTEEKYEFIKDFLHAIQVNRIDLLLAHSSSVYPAALLLCEATHINIESVAFFNPAGHRRIMAMRPAWFTEGSVKVYQNKFGRAVFKIFGKSFIKATNTVTVKPESMNNVMLSAQTMRYSNYKELEKYLEMIKQMNKPTLWAFSENDRLVEKEIFYEMIDIMGATEENIQKYDSNAKAITRYSDQANIRVLVFNSGGHYAFLKYSTEIINECDKFLQHILQSR